MQEVIAGLLAGRSVSDVAETAGVNRNTITRWYKESERFREMLEATEADLVSQIRAEMVSETADRLASLLPAAIDVLESVLDPENGAKPSDRMAAAAHVMRFSGLGARKEPPKAVPAVEGLLKGTRGPGTGD